MMKILKVALTVLGAGLLGWSAFGVFGIQALFVDLEAEEEIPEAVSSLISGSENGAVESNSQVLGKGSFHRGDGTYTISGNVFLNKVEGKINLTFTDLEVSNGPDLFVYAVKTDSTENKQLKETVSNGDFINLGSLKGNIGDQNYLLEDGFDPKEYQVISIWCRRFGRNFGSVVLDGV
ncbi:MAG: DM13 domain-containing protein [Akkermansiaceae bacterium]